MTTSPKNILLIEDDQDLGASTAEILGVNHKIEWVTTADEAFRVMSKREFDVAIVDLGLGLDSAVTLIQSFKRFRTPLPPLILFSAQPIEMIRDAVAATGAVVALQKPCSGSVIEEAIDYAVRTRDRAR